MNLTEENSNKPVITTKYVVDGNSTILSVFCDEDGDWQFFGKEEVNEDDAHVISIQQILEIDKSLANMPDLSEGQSAFRQNKESSWVIRN